MFHHEYPLTAINIGLNPFVLRQKANSPFSYFDGSWPEFLFVVRNHLNNVAEGYRPGVVKVTIRGDDAGRFRTGIVQLKEGDKGEWELAARKKGEAPVKQVRASTASRLPARVVDVVFYHKSLLTPDDCIRSDGTVVNEEWQVISINARTTSGDEPQTPETMWRNECARRGLKEGEGGSPAEYTAEQWFESFHYWRDKAMSKVD